MKKIATEVGIKHFVNPTKLLLSGEAHVVARHSCTGNVGLIISGESVAVAKSDFQYIDIEESVRSTQRRGFMANYQHCCDKEGGHTQETKVEIITLEDGRRAEKHVSFDENGNEVIEIFAEEKRPVKLEKRVIRQRKNIVAKETHQTVRDGDVVLEEIVALEPEVPLQIRERLGIVDHAKIVDNDYVRKEDIAKLIADGVVTGVQALMEANEEEVEQPQIAPQPALKRPTALQVVESNVEDKKKNEVVAISVLGVILLAQVAFVAYLLMGM